MSNSAHSTPGQSPGSAGPHAAPEGDGNTVSERLIRETDRPASIPSPTDEGASDGSTLEQSPHDARRAAAASHGSRNTGRAVPAVPGYEIESELGRGGMGVVYRGRHVQLDRPAAIKVLLGGQFADHLAQARFLVEAEAVAKVRHPNVVQVFEFGQCAGQPFFALEFVPGGTLAARLAAGGRFEPRAAAALVAKLADAVAAAHAQGGIHRDLKPANVLLDDRGEPKVTDFGLARVGASDLTATGAVMGTPSYMSPEQAAGRTKEVGTGTDVYALGVVLYELLTGRVPFKGDSVLDTIQQVKQREPQRPRALVPGLPRDLETICLKCLEKNPVRRYATAEGLGADLRAYLSGRPIAARPVGGPERLWKLARRNPVVASLLAAVACVTATGSALVAWQWQVAVRQAEIADERTAVAAGERDRKQAALQDATAQRAAAQAAEAEAVRQRNEATAARAAAERDRDAAREAVRQMEAARYVRLIADARRAARDRRPDLAREALFQTAEAPRGWEWHHTLRTLEDDRPVRLYGAQHHTARLAFSPDGRHVIVAGNGLDPGAVWDTRTASRLFRLSGIHSNAEFRFAADGKSVVALSTVFTKGGGGRESVLKGWAVPGGQLAFTHQFGDAEGRVVDFAVGPNGPLAVADPGAGKGVVVWDARTGARVATLNGARTAGYASLSPDGALVAVGNSPRDSAVEIRDARTGEVRHTLGPFPHWVHKPTFSPDGGRVALVTNAQARPMQLSVFGTDGRPLARVEEPPGAAFEQLGFSRTGDRLVFVVWTNRYKPGARAEVRVLDVGSGSAAFRHEVAPALLVGAALDPAGSRVAVASADAHNERVEVRVTDLATRREVLATTVPPGHIGGMAFTPDGSRLACVHAPEEPGTTPAGTVLLWDLSVPPGGAGRTVLAGHRSPVRPVAGRPDGSQFAAGADDGSVRVWAATGGEPAVYADHTRGVTGLAFHPGGERFASAAEDGVKVWAVGRGQPLRTLVLGGHAPAGVAFHPGGGAIASAGHDGTVRVWDAESGRHLAALAWEGDGKPAGGFEVVAYSPTGDTIAAGTNRGEGGPEAAPVVIWDAATRKELRRLAGHRGAVTAVAYAPDGQRVVTGGSDRAVRLWDAGTGRLLRTLTGHAGAVTGVAVGDGGRRAFSASVDRTVRVWDTETGQQLAAIDAGAPCGGVAVAGSWLAAGAGPSVLAWDGTPGRQVFALPPQPGGVLAVAVQADGAALALSTADRRDPASHRTVEPGHVAVWDLAPLRPRYTVGSAEVERRSPVAFGPAGRLASAPWDSTRKERRITVLEPSGETLWGAPPPRGRGADSGEAYAIAFRPAGDAVAVGGGPFDVRRPGAVDIRDAATGRALRRLEGVGGPVTSLAFSRDGTALVGGSSDFTVAVWDVPARLELPKGNAPPVNQPVRVLTGHQAPVRGVTISADGTRVAAVAADGAIRLWGGRDGIELPVAFAGHVGDAAAVAFSPDGRVLATGGGDGTVVLWSAETGARVLVAGAHDDRVTALAFSPDGTRLYSAGMDRHVRGWDVRIKR
jgi:WD40 repeat protein